MIGSIIGFCLSCWGLVSFFFFPESVSEIFWGMLAPLVIGVLTIWMVRRICRTEFQRLTSFMIKAFVSKVVVYAVYVIVIIGVYSQQPVPFIISFGVYFLVLHLVEAVYFRRLFSDVGRLSRGGDR